MCTVNAEHWELSAYKSCVKRSELENNAKTMCREFYILITELKCSDSNQKNE